MTLEGIRRLSTVAVAVAGGALICAPGATAQEPPIEAVPIETLVEPTYLEDAPGFPDLLFVTEKGGVVEILQNEEVRDEPFLDITHLVEPGGEQGLLSIAFPPDYEQSRRFYVYFSNNDGDIEVDEFKRRKANPLEAREASRRQVIKIPHPTHGNHNGGTVRVDAEGKLWMATGDGGGGGDPDDNARDLDSLLGKLLRVRPVPKDPDEPGYRIPRRNPFVGQPGRDEIFSYGLRNPFRFEVDDDLRAIEIGDVGQGAREEVTVVHRSVARGGNFGWPEYEGDLVYDSGRPGAATPIPPSFAYANPAFGAAAVTGGLIVRDPELPTLADRYLFADFYAGPLASLVPTLPSGAATDGRGEPLTIANPVAFTEGVGRQLYVTSLAGTVYRIEPAS